MRKLLGVLCVAGLLVGTASAQVGRLYFDLSGNDGTEDGARDGTTAGENPALGIGGGRLYVYWQFGHRGGADPLPPDQQKILGLGVDIETTGDVEITGSYYYNPTLLRVPIVLKRWNEAYPNPAQAYPDDTTSIAFQAANVNQIGLINAAGTEEFDLQHDPSDLGEFGTTLLGYVDVTGADGAVWFAGNNFGIAEVGGDPSDLVYFGFGDPPVDGRRSRDPDATIVPEPASLMLLGLSGLALRRRR